MQKKGSLPLIAMLVLSLICACVPVQAQEALPTEAPARTASELYHLKTEAVMERKVVPYVKDFLLTGEERGETALYFMEDSDIPYVALSEFMPMLTEALEKNRDRAGITYLVERGEPGYAVTRADANNMMLVDPAKDTILFLDYNAFTQKGNVISSLSLADLPEPPVVDVQAMLAQTDLTDPASVARFTAEFEAAHQPAPESFFVAAGNTINRGGDVKTLNLAEYMIDIVEHSGECYLPLQTMCDLFMCRMYLHYIYNGHALYGLKYGSALLDEVYTADPVEEMSPAFAMYNFNELEFMLDCFYGLKQEHNIGSFARMLGPHTGLMKGLISTKPEEVDAAIAELTGKYFDDGHSGFIRGSWRSGEKTESMLQLLANEGLSGKYQGKAVQRFAAARKAVFPDGVPMYQEIGDTAFITFDHFVAKEQLKDYYHMEPLDPAEFVIRDPSEEVIRDQMEELIGALGLDGLAKETEAQATETPAPTPAPAEEGTKPDVIRLLMYARKQITREGSPIRQIVIDLSLNGGGDSNAALYLISWLLGHADIALRDTFTGAETVTFVKTDLEAQENYESEVQGMANLGYRIWCLTSMNSFSCGNLVPAALKMSGQATLIGQRSGGGSCVVLACTSASGALFQISGSEQLSIVRNGSFYNIDQGIEPDVMLTQVESFYDREGLVEYLHSLK